MAVLGPLDGSPHIRESVFADMGQSARWQIAAG